MKKYNKIMALVIAVFCVLIIGINIFAGYGESKKTVGNKTREYRVWINRVISDIDEFENDKKQSLENIDELMTYMNVDEYPYIEDIECISIDDIAGESLFFNEENDDYVVYTTDNYIYKITYMVAYDTNYAMLWVNVIAVFFFIVTIIILIYIKKKIIVPFNKLTDIPYELSKGNLTVPLKESKGKLFGRFLWGMDLLRENIEDNKKRELELQKEKKMLLLSLSHDIKTPLSAIKLYSKALTKNLYKNEEKKMEIIENIGVKVNEIEGFIAEIVKASNDDFISFTVENDEFYIKGVLDQIAEYYAEKMQLNQIDFSVDCSSNCIVYGDSARAVEVIQNIIENAIKYGDGKSIKVSAEKEEETYVVSIKNTGCTLEKREIAHIFDSFFRGSNVGKENGSGLGLYICRKLMNMMEGEITAKIIETEHSQEMCINIMFRM